MNAKTTEKDFWKKVRHHRVHTKIRRLAKQFPGNYLWTKEQIETELDRLDLLAEKNK